MINIDIQAMLPNFDNFSFVNTFDKVSKLMETSIKRNFAEGGRPTTWKPLKKSGQPSHLFITGELFNSITGWYDNDSASAGVTSGQEEIYFYPHQYGSEKRNIPKREYILFQEDDKRDIMKMFEEDLVQFFNTKGEKIA